MTHPPLDLMATYFLVAASSIAVWDVLYLHVYTYRLHVHAASRFEHWLHTWQLFLNGVSILLLFLCGPAGAVLWIGLGAILGGTVVEVMDAFCERQSRLALGGLSSGEYALHLLGASLRASAFVLIIAATPTELWNLSATGLLAVSRPTHVRVIGGIFGGGALVAGLHHLLIAGTGDGRSQRGD